MSVLSVDAAVAEIANWNSGIVNQNPEQFAKLLELFVHNGSQLHQLSKDSLEVYSVPPGTLLDGEESLPPGTTGRRIARTVTGLLATGTKFFDAVVYLSLKESDRPKAIEHPKTAKPDKGQLFPVYNDVAKITKCIFAVYFYIMIRGHAPTEAGDYKGQAMPKFLSTILGIKDTPKQVASYVSSFDLNSLDPAWVRYIKTTGLSQEASSRFGLGVAGYRLTSVFNLVSPDKYRTTATGTPVLKGEEDRHPLEDKPPYLDAAVKVAASFLRAGLCWDFHPATRKPDVLSKYGNINKNCANLIIESYTTDTIARMVKTKKLAVQPTFDDSHTQFRQWSTDIQYVAKAKIFA